MTAVLHSLSLQSLEAELRRLQEASAQGLEGFDSRLKKLFHLKIKTEMAVNQEELKVLRLGVALMTEREIADKEEELYTRMEESKNKKVCSSRGCVATAVHSCSETLWEAKAVRMCSADSVW